jgi:hypothetical protein
MPLGRARLQLFRPASIHLDNALDLHFGSEAVLSPDPPAAPVEPKAGTNLEISIRNNTTAIRTYHLQPSGDGLEFFPQKMDIAIGATALRQASFRVFAKDTAAMGLRDWHLRVTGGADLDLPMRAVLIPKGRTAAWTADLDSDGSPEWILESTRIRAVFSPRDGGRWLDFTWKDTNVNFLSDAGAFAGSGSVEIHGAGDALEFTAPGWKRTVTLAGNVLTIDQTTPLPADGPKPEKVGNVNLTIERPSPTRAVYTVH